MKLGKPCRTSLRRLGAEVCYIATFEDCKDANEYLLKYGKEKLAQCITGAKPVPLEGVTTFKDIEGEITDFVRKWF
jgi:twinkle protein